MAGVRLLLILALLVFHAEAQDGKRKASEYFCVAQCLGLLNSGSPAGPDKSQCYMPPNICANTAFMNLNTCCKDHPQTIFKENTVAPCLKVSQLNGAPLKILLSYTISTAVGDSGRFDFSAGSESLLVKKWGKQMVYVDCAFREQALISGEAINYDAVKKAFEQASASNPAYYTPLIGQAVNECKDKLAVNYATIPAKIKVPDAKGAEANPLTLLLHQCIRRALLVQPCSSAAASNAAVQFECALLEDLRKCDPFAKS